MEKTISGFCRAWEKEKCLYRLGPSTCSVYTVSDVPSRAAVPLRHSGRSSLRVSRRFIIRRHRITYVPVCVFQSALPRTQSTRRNQFNVAAQLLSLVLCIVHGVRTPVTHGTRFSINNGFPCTRFHYYRNRNERRADRRSKRTEREREKEEREKEKKERRERERESDMATVRTEKN